MGRDRGERAIDLASLAPAFRPRSVAVIGASRDPAKIGGLPIAFMKASGFSGALYPVNPAGDEIQGLRSYRSVTEIPGAVDLAIVAVPAPAVLPALGDCRAKGVRAAVVFSAGFAEVDERGRALQAEMASLARESGMRILGPNCMGVVNFGTGLVANFHPAFKDGIGKAGRIGLVGQSGALSGLCFTMAADRGLAYSASASTGNEADVDAADCLAWLAEDPDTTVIQLYLEGCRDGRKLMAALDLARARKKPVICLKPGSTAEGAAAVASHTAALAGCDAVFDAVLRQMGAYRAHSLEEFFDVAAACAVGVLPRNDRLGLVTVSGGIGVLMADSAVRAGLEVSALPEHAQGKIRELVSFAATRNPVDITGHAVNVPTLTDKALAIVIEDGGYGSVILSIGAGGRNPVRAPQLLETCAALRRRFPETLLCLSCLHTADFRQKLAAIGCLCLEEPVHAVRAVAALAGFRRAFIAPAAVPAPPVFDPLPSGPMDEPTALAALSGAGIPVVPHRLVRTADEAVRVAAELGYPVALKVVAPEILHKTELGGVALRLASADAVRASFAEITARVAAAQPEATLRGCLVAPMIEGAVETILGIKNDPAFGPMVALGLGGTLVEALGDVALRAAPIGLDEARAMIKQLKGRRILDGIRGAPPADIGALADAIVRLSQFAAAHANEIASLDINPFAVLPRGGGAMALDALIERRF
ncbi:MAG TPA: acetate--CoA ligase family protein [Stellaceae bacterium]|nr:acetate--CoA ligase family protein [Stellaceae bacterium]